jgi:glycosyltransferase involved in cell wall biosynthesis
MSERLLSIPARHPYVDAVRPVDVETVRSDRVSGFELDPAFTPGAITALAPEIDLVHVHFGFDQLTADEMRAWTEELRAAGVPLVVTVHDLRNPHHLSPEQHDAVLTELLAAADGVITLTPGAATAIRGRFGREAQVIAHPTLVDQGRTAAIPREPGLVVLHLKSLRRNLQDPLRLVAAALAGARRTGGRLRVDVHPEVLDDPRLRGLTDSPEGLEVVVHPRFDDLELEQYLRRAQVTVVPHRWGTHSGWLELARDLGTRVVAGDGGYYAEQWDEVVTFGSNEVDGLDDASLADAVARALRMPLVAPGDPASRQAQAARIRQDHADLYAGVLALPLTRAAR